MTSSKRIRFNLNKALLISGMPLCTIYHRTGILYWGYRRIVPHCLIGRFFRLVELICLLFRRSVGRRPCHPSAHGLLPRRCPAGQDDHVPTRKATKFNENACALRCSSFTLESFLASWQRYVPACRAEQ